uniref:Uncharacterized protein n=1 Tax=Cyprinus carpio TaxID=7962 RepID=A0A8C1MZY0_CYPCA
MYRPVYLFLWEKINRKKPTYQGLTCYMNNVSLSPCIFRTVEDTEMYPSKYEEAECLCDGCIINGVENRTYNSVPVKQTRLFLKKVPCPSDPKKYSLEYKLVSVTVACTCFFVCSALHYVQMV